MTQHHKPKRCGPTGHGYYSFRNWSQTFVCPECGRTGRFNLNFLGQRVVSCNGHRFAKSPKDAWDEYAKEYGE